MTWQGSGDGGEQEPAAGEREMTPFEIRPSWSQADRRLEPGAEVWICVGRFADVAEAQLWVDAESWAEVEWDTLLRGVFWP